MDVHSTCLTMIPYKRVIHSLVWEFKVVAAFARHSEGYRKSLNVADLTDLKAVNNRDLSVADRKVIVPISSDTQGCS
jgi:hypothetical protein